MQCITGIQFHPIAHCLDLLVGWIIALVICSRRKKLMQKIGTNHELSSVTGALRPYRSLISNLFLVCDILAVVGALNNPFSNMVGRVLAYIPNLLAAIAVGFIGLVVARLVRVD